MNSFNYRNRVVKPASCESLLVDHPIAPCELSPNGLPGSILINGTVYVAEILGYLPPVGEPHIDGYRLTKGNGEAHDVCLVAGRMECTCGDWSFRRACQANRDVQDCKHVIACKRHFVRIVDQQPTAPVYAGACDDLENL